MQEMVVLCRYIAG